MLWNGIYSIKMTCFSHIIAYFIIWDFLSHRNRKKYTLSVSIYTVSARNYVLCAEITQKMQEILPSFLKKSCQQKFSAPCGHDGREKYHLWYWHDVLRLQGRPSWLWNWQTPGRKPKPEYYYSIVRKLLLLGHLLRCNHIPFTFSSF